MAVEVDPAPDAGLGLRSCLPGGQVDTFIVQGRPEPLDEDVIDALTLPPIFIQRERDSGSEFCPYGRIGQRGLAWSFAYCAASGPVAA